MTGNTEKMRLEKQGATLIEVLISLIVLSILMTVFADLVTRYSRVLRHQEKKDRNLANLKMALDTVTGELEEALVVYSPDDDGKTLPEVIFWRYTPDLPDEKLIDRGGISVRYYLDSSILYREVTDSGGSKSRYAVAQEVASFSVRREHSRFFAVSVTFEESQSVYTISADAFLKPGI